MKIDSGKREAVSVAEDNLEEMGGVGEVVEKDTSKATSKKISTYRYEQTDR